MLKDFANLTLTPEYELITNFITLVNIAALIVLDYMVSEGAAASSLETWVVVQICVNFAFFIELVAEAIAHGPFKAYS